MSDDSRNWPGPRERFAAAMDELPDLDTSALASGEAVPTVREVGGCGDCPLARRDDRGPMATGLLLCRGMNGRPTQTTAVPVWCPARRGVLLRLREESGDGE